MLVMATMHTTASQLKNISDKCHGNSLFMNWHDAVPATDEANTTYTNNISGISLFVSSIQPSYLLQVDAPCPKIMNMLLWIIFNSPNKYDLKAESVRKQVIPMPFKILLFARNSIIFTLQEGSIHQFLDRGKYGQPTIIWAVEVFSKICI